MTIIWSNVLWGHVCNTLLTSPKGLVNIKDVVVRMLGFGNPQNLHTLECVIYVLYMCYIWPHAWSLCKVLWPLKAFQKFCVYNVRSSMTSLFSQEIQITLLYTNMWNSIVAFSMFSSFCVFHPSKVGCVAVSYFHKLQKKAQYILQYWWRLCCGSINSYLVMIEQKWNYAQMVIHHQFY